VHCNFCTDLEPACYEDVVSVPHCHTHKLHEKNFPNVSKVEYITLNSGPGLRHPQIVSEHTLPHISINLDLFKPLYSSGEGQIGAMPTI
jgi:hypothetical protein